MLLCSMIQRWTHWNSPLMKQNQREMITYNLKKSTRTQLNSNWLLQFLQTNASLGASLYMQQNLRVTLILYDIYIYILKYHKLLKIYL